MTAKDSRVSCIGSLNIAIASGAALGYLPAPDWLLLFMFWPSVVFVPLLAMIAAVDFIHERAASKGELA